MTEYFSVNISGSKTVRSRLDNAVMCTNHYYTHMFTAQYIVLHYTWHGMSDSKERVCIHDH